MMKFMRLFFGFGASSGTRKVVGKSIPVDVKNVTYITESAARLKTLYHLYKRYKGSPHEQKIKAVYDKTNKIHSYLVSKNSVYELELFHLQNTDHFINTFTVIMDVHQQHNDVPIKYARIEEKPEIIMNSSGPQRVKKVERVVNGTEMIRPISNGQPNFYQKEERSTDVPKLTIPEISINTFAKVRYRNHASGEGVVSDEVGFTSTPLEKEAFLHYISTQMGMSNISYVGNAMMTLPNNNGSTPTGLVPIIHWEGSLYAINLNDFRLFPVKAFRKNF